MVLPKDEFMKSCSIKRETEGHTDSEGSWVPEGEETIAEIAKVDIQPKSGGQRATEAQTVYESDHLAIFSPDDLEYEEGHDEIRRGDTLEVNENDEAYKVVFIADWKTHFELDLEEAK